MTNNLNKNTGVRCVEQIWMCGVPDSRTDPHVGDSTTGDPQGVSLHIHIHIPHEIWCPGRPPTGDPQGVSLHFGFPMTHMKCLVQDDRKGRPYMLHPQQFGTSCRETPCGPPVSLIPTCPMSTPHLKCGVQDDCKGRPYTYTSTSQMKCRETRKGSPGCGSPTRGSPACGRPVCWHGSHARVS